MAPNNADLEGQQHRTDQAILNGDTSTEARAREMIKQKVIAFYSRGVPVVDAWMAVSFFAKMKSHVSLTSTWAIMYLVCLLLSFLADMVIMINKVGQDEIQPSDFLCRYIIPPYLSTILQISSAVALMLFFNTTGTVTVIPFFCLVLVFVFCFFYQMLDPQRKPGFRWLDHKGSLNRGFEMAAMVVAPSVAGLSGKVLGYAEGSTAGGHGLMAVAPECFLFYSAVCGLLVVLLCTVPPSVGSNKYVKRVANIYIPGVANTALLFLAVATVVAAEKILHDVYLVCCPIAILAMYLCLRDAQCSSDIMPLTTNHQPARLSSLDAEFEAEANRSRYLFKGGISSILLGIMAIHSSYGGIGSTVPLSWSLKAFVFSAVCSILSYTVRIFILGWMTEEKRYEISRNFWDKGTLLTIIISIVFAIVAIWLHPDGFMNIF